jgi:hypothetical protein
MKKSRNVIGNPVALRQRGAAAPVQTEGKSFT